MDSHQIFKFLTEKAETGEKAALVTVTKVEGSSIRNPGAHMGVSENGEFVGSLSGGCIEDAVVAEAQDAIKQGKPRSVRFGAGSPYIDIKLPCGGGLDILFFPIKKDTFSKSAVD
ncbi:Xanthine and CO dehydrogenases maturation factor, XdhC/CoxF family, partial [hydrothermal vent metagenome]